jgi:tape measure domain-containing protein
MADLQKTVAIIFAGTDSTAAALQSVGKNVDSIGANATDAESKVVKLNTQVEKLGDSGSGKVLNLVNSMKTLAGAVVVHEFIDANVAAEQFMNAMTVLLGSSKEAANEFEYVKALANTLGLELGATAKAYVSLTAATQGSSLAGSQTKEIFEAVVIAMAKLGKSSDDVNGALLAISQMASKGTVSMEELRGQLGEKLPGAFSIAATAMGVTTAQLTEMISEGNVTADVFLPKLAAALKNVYGDVAPVDTFQASWNALKNSVNDAFVAIGNTGVMEVVSKVFDGLALGVTATVETVKMFGKELGNLWYLLTTLDYKGYLNNNASISEEFLKNIDAARSKFLGLKGDLEEVDKSGQKAAAALTSGMKDSVVATVDLKKAAKEADEQLKLLGLDPNKFKDDVAQTSAEIVSAFQKLAENPAVKGDQLLAGFLVALDKLKGKDLDTVGFALQDAFQKGKLSAEQLEAATYALETKQQGLWSAMIVTTKASTEQTEALKKQQAATQKAEESAQKYALEMEKLASNEKIKAIESKVKLDIAEVEANAKIAEKLMDSLAATYSSDVKLIGDILGSLSAEGNTLSDKFKMSMALAANERVEELHQAQMKLVQAQIEYMQMKTAQMAQGNPLISIESDGLEPELEAFMWQILKKIQVKMSQEGSDFLLGSGGTGW